MKALLNKNRENILLFFVFFLALILLSPFYVYLWQHGASKGMLMIYIFLGVYLDIVGIVCMKLGIRGPAPGKPRMKEG